MPISPEEYAAGDPNRADAEATHAIDVLGVPLLFFHPYTRGIRYLNGEGG